MNERQRMYMGLPEGQSKNSVDDKYSLHEVTSHRDMQNRKNGGKPKPNKKVRSGNTDMASVVSPGSNHKNTPKSTKNKGAKTRAKDERAKVSSVKQNTPIERGFKHKANFETPISAAFLPPEVLEINRQLSNSHSSDVEEINLSYRALGSVNYCFKDLQVKHISTIDVSHNHLQVFPECFQLPSLKCITLASNELKYLGLKNEMANLSVLVLSSNRIENFPSAQCLQYLPSLRRLILHNNKIKEIHPDSLKKLGEIGLIDLNLSFNHLKSLPVEISKVSSLHSLHLMTNRLVSLPATITLLPLLERLDVTGNKLTSPPQEVASRGIDAVKRYFHELQNETEAYEKKFGPSTAPERIRSSQFKLIVVGHERSGKTSSIRCLTRSIVKVKLPGGGQCYGKLTGMFDDGRYAVLLLDDGGRQDGQAKFDNDEEEFEEGYDFDGDAAREERRSDGEDGHQRRRGDGEQWRKTRKKDRIIGCRDEDIEICGPMINGDNESTTSDEDTDFWDSLAPPLSTIGIDIDMWRPAITCTLLKNKFLNAKNSGFCSSSGSTWTGNRSNDKKSEGAYTYGRFHCGEYEEEEETSRHYSDNQSDYMPASASCMSASNDICDNFPKDLTLSIWDFAGQEIYHSAHEAFFSERALYLIVWDMRKNTPSEFDEYVQFWIDLIQTRAPGSSMLVVGTHVDEVKSYVANPTSKNEGSSSSRSSRKKKKRRAPSNPVEKVVDDLRQRLKRNEIDRVKGIEADIKLKLKRDSTAELQSLRTRRPNLVGIIPVSCKRNLQGFNVLTKRILELSTPTVDNPHPFQLVNIEIPNYYMDVKYEIETMIRDDRVAAMEHLHNNMKARKLDDEDRRDITRDAVTFLSSVGEVVWFGNASRFFSKDAATRMREGSGNASGSANGVRPASSHAAPEEDIHWDADSRSGCSAHHSQLAFSPARGGEVGVFDSLEHIDTGCHDDLESIDTEANRSGLSGFQSSHWEGLDDTWKDVNGESHLNTDVPMLDKTPPRKKRDQKPNIIDDVIFLCPNWLLNTMKKVLTHHLAEDLKDIIDEMSESDKVYYFGVNHHEHIANGVVRWQFIEDKLLADVDLPSHSLFKRPVTASLRTLFKRFDIIIPVHTYSRFSHSADGNNHTSDFAYCEDEDSHDPPVLSRPPSLTQQGSSSSQEDFYLVSTLLSPVETPLIPQYAAAGYVKLDRKFVLEKFVPPGLMQRIMAKTFFQFGTDPSAKHNPAPSSKNCWKNAFFQSFHSNKFSVIDIWVWLEEGKGLGGQVRIAGFGNLFVTQEVIAYMNRYSSAVYEILSTFPGLCYVSEVTMCPVCSMHQRAPDNCGIFTERDITKLQHDLNDIVSQTSCAQSTTPQRQRATSTSSVMSDLTNHAEDQHKSEDQQMLSWRQLRARCSKNGCNVSADLLVRVPPVLLGRKSVSERSEQTIAFLLEEIVRLSAVPSTNIEPCICKIAICYTLTSNVEVFKENMAKRTTTNLTCGASPIEDMITQSDRIVAACDVKEIRKELFTKIGDQRSSGVLASIPAKEPGDKTCVVITCEHFMTDFETMKHAPGCPEDERNWLYVADLIMRGSEYGVGSRTWFSEANNEGMPIPKPSTARQQSLGSAASSNVRVENRPYERGIWDVSALKILCAIDPIDVDTTATSLKLILRPESLLPSVGHSATKGGIRPIQASLTPPQVEQSLRLMSFQLMESISISWGRMIQRSSEGMLLVNIYGDNGSSGGAVVDREGRLVGILSMSTLGKQVAYIEPVVPIIRAVQNII